MSADTSYDARTGEVVEHIEVSSPSEIAEALSAAEAAAPRVAAATPAERRGWLEALAGALTEPETAEALVGTADRETALGDQRLRGELARCAGQLRFYGDVAAEGSYLEATIDHATLVAPEMRRMTVPLGPVAVLGASNFPFAFGTLGNDTASALAAGCPVLAKAHPAHPATSRILGAVAAEALAAAGAPAGTFALLSGFASGQQLVCSPQTKALAFTGSHGAGMALWQMANDREVVIPVYAEMGTINPVVMTPDALDRVDAIATGFVASMSLGMGSSAPSPDSFSCRPVTRSRAASPPHSPRPAPAAGCSPARSLRVSGRVSTNSARRAPSCSHRCRRPARGGPPQPPSCMRGPARSGREADSRRSALARWRSSWSTRTSPSSTASWRGCRVPSPAV
jgi:NADP-dependent aldehyde dehydrogenase